VYDLDLIVVTPAKSPFVNIDIPWEGIEILSLVPYQLDFLLSISSKELFNCKTILLGGAPLSQTLRKRLLNENFRNVYETYGMTETLSHIALKALKEDYFTTLQGIGISIDNRGCLSITDTFLNLNNLITNDLIEIKNTQSFKWLGRYDNIINTGGIKVLTEELEVKIKAILPKNELIIFSRKHPSLGEEINLLIEGDQFEIKTNFFTPILDRYLMPKNIYFLKRFNRTSTQKILRQETIKKLSID
jgi:O-succinylbenzoic acid--CoA ligase